MSEFGQGLSYCLGLFLAHEFKGIEQGKKDDKVKQILNKFGNNEYTKLWFYGAADHILELEIPSFICFHPIKRIRLIRRLKIFFKKIVSWRLPMTKKQEPTEKDRLWALQEAKELLRLWDESCGIKTMKGDWE